MLTLPLHPYLAVFQDWRTSSLKEVVPEGTCHRREVSSPRLREVQAVEVQHKLTPNTRSLERLAPPDKETLEEMDSTGTALFNLRAVEVVRGPQGKRQTNP
jgi:hypothetical protein